MRDTAVTVARTGIVRGLATLCEVLDDLPAVGLGNAGDRSTTGREGELPAADGGPTSDDVVRTVGGLRLYPRGGWGSRLTTLRFLSADLDHRWGTRVWPDLDRPLPPVGTRLPRPSVPKPVAQLPTAREPSGQKSWASS